MSQHDYNIADALFPAFRTDLNNALLAAQSNNSGATEPASMAAYMWWVDTTTGLLKQRNAANSAWVTMATLATGAAAAVAVPSASKIYLDGIAGTGDTYIFESSANVLDLFAGGVNTLRLSATAAIITGAALIGDTANANNTAGLTINMQTADDDIVTLKSSDVAHAMTALTEADTFGTFSKSTSTAGGLHISGYRDADGVAGNALFFQGTLGEAADATKSTAGIGIVSFSCEVTDGGTGATTAAANANLFVVRNDATTRFILDADGDSHQDVGTAWTNFHGHDDHEMLSLLSAHVSRQDDPIRERFFGEFLSKRRDVLERVKLVTFNDDGHHFVNMSKLAMLNTGAILQAGDRITSLASAVNDHDQHIQNLIAENAMLKSTLERLEHRNA